MSCATLWAPRNRSPVSDWTDVGSTESSERRCKGIRRTRFEMAGIAPASIASERTVQRRVEGFILRENDDGLNVLGGATRRGLYAWWMDMRLTDTAALAAGGIERGWSLSSVSTMSFYNLSDLARTPSDSERESLHHDSERANLENTSLSMQFRSCRETSNSSSLQHCK